MLNFCLIGEHNGSNKSFSEIHVFPKFIFFIRLIDTLPVLANSRYGNASIRNFQAQLANLGFIV